MADSTVPHFTTQQRLDTANNLLDNKLAAAGCNEQDAAIGKATLRHHLLKGASIFRSVEEGLAAAHREMDQRTASKPAL